MGSKPHSTTMKTKAIIFACFQLLTSSAFITLYSFTDMNSNYESTYFNVCLNITQQQQGEESGNITREVVKTIVVDMNQCSDLLAMITVFNSLCIINIVGTFLFLIGIYRNNTNIMALLFCSKMTTAFYIVFTLCSFAVMLFESSWILTSMLVLFVCFLLTALEAYSSLFVLYYFRYYGTLKKNSKEEDQQRKNILCEL